MNNKQRKEKTMRKIAMIVGLVSVLATNANAGYTWSQSNILGGYNYYSSDSGMLGYSQGNILGGYNYYWK